MTKPIDTNEIKDRLHKCDVRELEDYIYRLCDEIDRLRGVQTPPQVNKYINFGPVRHIKTGNKYIFTNVVIDTTNGRGDRKMCLYHYDGPAPKSFVRDLEEFIEKFEEWKDE